MENKESPNVIIKAGGLKCDNPKCDWIDNTVSASDYHQWINKPCPQCGDNLLTIEDYQRAESLLAMAHLINSLPKELLDSDPAKTPEESLEEIKNSPLFKDVKGIEELTATERVSIRFDTHNEIKVSEIKSV